MKRILRIEVDAAPNQHLKVMADTVQQALEHNGIDVITVKVGSWEYQYREKPKSW